jgi:hypothetical protein
MWTTPVNVARLDAIFAPQLARHIPYRLGGKAPTLNATPAQLAKGIDCSGEVRLLLYQVTDGAMVLPDGSWNQRAWAEQNLEEVPYSTALHAGEGELFIAFITAHVNGSGGVGHVWLVRGRKSGTTNTTFESHGGKGINSRPADTPVLVREAHKCFRIPTTATKPVVAPQPHTPDPFTPKLILNTIPIPGAKKENGRWMVPLGELRDELGYTVQQTATDKSGGEHWNFYKP